MMMNKALLVILSIGFAAAASAQQFKWVDKDGRTQYGDSPPPGVKATPLKAPPGPAPVSSAPSSGAAKKDKPLSPEEAFKKRQQDAKEKQEKDAKELADASAKKENCARAQQNVATYSAGGRVTRVDAKGERVFLDEAQIAAELAKAQAAARQACG
jgi:hypothetical protein